jgi:hypothetical protein
MEFKMIPKCSIKSSEMSCKGKVERKKSKIFKKILRDSRKI